MKTDKTERCTTALEAESPVSSKMSDFKPSAHAQSNILHVKYAEKIDDHDLGFYCLGKCVGLGFMLQWEKEINWSLRLSPIFFTGFTCSRTVACCGHLTSNQNVLIYTTHIKKVIAKLCSFTLRRKQWQKMIGQKFRLTPGYRQYRISPTLPPPKMLTRALQMWFIKKSMLCYISMPNGLQIIIF